MKVLSFAKLMRPLLKTIGLTTNSSHYFKLHAASNVPSKYTNIFIPQKMFLSIQSTILYTTVLRILF